MPGHKESTRHEIKEEADGTNPNGKGLSRKALENAARYASNNSINSAINEFSMSVEKVLTRKDSPNPEKLKEIQEKRRNEASAVKQTLENNSRDMSEERTEYRIDLEKHPILKEFSNRTENSYIQDIGWEPGSATLPPEIQRKVDKEVGERFKTREIRNHLHNMDWQFAHKWQNSLSKIEYELDENTTLSHLQKIGKFLYDYWNWRDYTVKQLKLAKYISIEQYCDIAVISPVAYWLNRNFKHQLKGRAMTTLARQEQCWLDANQDREKPLTRNIHKSSLKEEFDKLTASIDRNSEIQQDQNLKDTYDNVVKRFNEVFKRTASPVKELTWDLNRKIFNETDEHDARKLYLKACVDWLNAVDKRLNGTSEISWEDNNYEQISLIAEKKRFIMDMKL
jgi:ElaB/YqjD/DUF883 family membrane-anchored ribosome-binding protein